MDDFAIYYLHFCNLFVTMVTSNEVNQMYEPKSVVRRVGTDKATVIDFIAAEKKWTPITAMNEVIETSTLFNEARLKYKLSGDIA